MKTKVKFKQTEIGMISEDWEVKGLEEVASYITEKINIDEINPKRFISTENMISDKGGITIPSSLPKGKVTHFKEKDILFSNIRTYFKKLWLARFEGGCSNDVLVIRPKDSSLSDIFLYYYLSQDYFFEYTVLTSKGTKMPRGDKNAIMNFQINIPGLAEQSAIAKILSDLDSKIELNQQMNKTLEAIGQAIFKHWFVNFEFPNEKGKPYKSSGGEMVDSELGEIPKGWEVLNIDKLTEHITTGLNPRDNFKLGRGYNNYITIKNISENHDIVFDDSSDKVDDNAIKKIHFRAKLAKGDILFSGVATIGRVYYIDKNPTKWGINESIFSFRANENYLSTPILYWLLISQNFQLYAQQLASGSVQRGIRMSDLRKYLFAVPKLSEQQFFSNTLGLIISKMKNNFQEISELITLRDSLLPKLMSGKIRVPVEART